jgi:Tol biopolymer transport system component
MLYVLGTPFANVTKSWFAYYQQRYNQERILFESDPGELLKYKNKHNSPVTQMAISPDGRQLAYVLNRIGKVQVFVQDIQTGKRKKVFQNGFRNAFQETDLQYPHIAWHPSSQYLAILYEKQDKIKLLVKDLITDKDEIQDFAPIYQRVYSMHYI